MKLTDERDRRADATHDPEGTSGNFENGSRARPREDAADTLSECERADALETLQIVLEARPDAKTLPLLLRDLASMRDMAWLARATGMNRTALFRSLSANSNPKLDTIVAILRSFGLRLSVEPIRRV